MQYVCAYRKEHKIIVGVSFAVPTLHACWQDLTGFDDGATLKALHGRPPASPRPPRSPMRATASHPDPNPSHSANPPPLFPPCLSSPPDFAGGAKRDGWAQQAGHGALSPARRGSVRSAEVLPTGSWGRGRQPAPLQPEGFDGFCVRPLDEVRCWIAKFASHVHSPKCFSQRSNHVGAHNGGCQAESAQEARLLDG